MPIWNKFDFGNLSGAQCIACYKCQGKNKPLPPFTDISQIRLISIHIRQSLENPTCVESHQPKIASLGKAINVRIQMSSVNQDQTQRGQKHHVNRSEFPTVSSKSWKFWVFNKGILDGWHFEIFGFRDSNLSPETYFSIKFIIILNI